MKNFNKMCVLLKTLIEKPKCFHAAVPEMYFYLLASHKCHWDCSLQALHLARQELLSFHFLTTPSFCHNSRSIWFNQDCSNFHSKKQKSHWLRKVFVLLFKSSTKRNAFASRAIGGQFPKFDRYHENKTTLCSLDKTTSLISLKLQLMWTEPPAVAKVLPVPMIFLSLWVQGKKETKIYNSNYRRFIGAPPTISPKKKCKSQ